MRAQGIATAGRTVRTVHPSWSVLSPVCGRTCVGPCHVCMGPPAESNAAVCRLEMPTWVLVVISITNDMSAMFTSFDKVGLGFASP